MNTRQRVRIEMLKRAATFGREHASHFLPKAPATGPTEAQLLLAELEKVLTEISQTLTRQESGTPGAGTTDKGSLRDALLSDLRAIARAVAYLAVRRSEPSWMERFRLPTGGSDATLVHRARAFAMAVQELHLVADLVNLELEPDFVTVLLERVEEFEAADSGQGEAMANQVGAGASRAMLITQGLTVVRGLNVIMNNKFKGNADILGNWKFSSHVERTGERPRVPVTAPTLSAPVSAPPPVPAPASARPAGAGV